MNNTLNVNGQNIQIVNPTRYNPDNIVACYVEKKGTTVKEAMQETGLIDQAAAQDLFVRAVRSKESEGYREKLLNICTLYIFVKNLGSIGSTQEVDGTSVTVGPMDYIISSSLEKLFVGFLVDLAYHCIIGCTDSIGINIQYSI